LNHEKLIFLNDVQAEFAEIDLSAQFHWFPEKSSGYYLNYGVAATEVNIICPLLSS
jgi:hypothetical protein